ncbi:unnamed protein product [Arabidopsis halleri]
MHRHMHPDARCLEESKFILLIHQPSASAYVPCCEPIFLMTRIRKPDPTRLLWVDPVRFRLLFK